MASSAPPILRFPLILLAIANLALLAKLVLPLDNLLSLPGNGLAGFDLGISLLAYAGILYWAGHSKEAPMQRALGNATMLGILAAGLTVLELSMKTQAASQDTAPPSLMTKGLLGAAAIMWGIAGIRGARATGNGGVGLLTGAWSAMVSGLAACTTLIVLQFYYTIPVQMGDYPKNWKEYQGILVGSPATQHLILSLNSATFFLLVGPLAGAAIGLLFALFAGSNSKK